MALDTFKIGDIVQLKSGGPIMTIHGEHMYGGAICQWFNKNEEIKTERFAEESLKTHIERTTTVKLI